MARFIEEFYYGNIDPQARSAKKNKTVQKEMAVLTKTEELLTNALTDEPKKWFLDFANAWSVINGESNLDSFIMGFRLGANFALNRNAVWGLVKGIKSNYKSTADRMKILSAVLLFFFRKVLLNSLSEQTVMGRLP